MSSKQNKLSDADKERIAAQIVAASEGLISVPKAMKEATMSTPIRKNETVKKRVYRTSKKLIEQYKDDGGFFAPAPLPVPVAEAGPRSTNGTTSLSSLSSASGLPSRSSASTSVTPRPIDNIDDLRRKLPVDNGGSGIAVAPAAVQKKKRRRSSKQLQQDDATTASRKKWEHQAMKKATTRIYQNNKLDKDNTKKLTQVAIVQQVNEAHGTNISVKSASRMVREGNIGVSPLKRGPIGNFPKHIWNAMKVGYTSFIKLEQAKGKKQYTVKELSLRVNTMANSGSGNNRTRQDLTRRLKRETADEFDVDKKNVAEQRRAQWTTHHNLKLWFDTWKHTLIDLGFARERIEDLDVDKNVEGSIKFFPGQLNRIINIDETDGSLDNTTGQRGGRPPMTFYAKDITGGATQANKSSYSPTIIMGSTAAGEALPPHFQLKTTAQNSENQRLNFDFVTKCKDVYGQFGFPTRKKLPVTYGLNERAGMNAEELKKYVHKAIVPLYPDVVDLGGKRVILKVDSGPGRMNLELLAEMRLLGFYLIPGVPNTTGSTQEMDQNYGPFKSVYRGNIEKLAQFRFQHRSSLSINDLPLLVFGGRAIVAGKPEAGGVDLDDAFDLTFSRRHCLSAWKKCGAVPLTSAPLYLDQKVRHEIVLDEEGNIDLEADPEGSKLERIEQANHLVCDYLCSMGYDGTQLRTDAPRVKSKASKITAPYSEARILAIEKAKTAGQHFHATGGQHLNSDELFEARARAERKESVKKLEDKRKKLLEKHQHRLDAEGVIRQHGEPLTETTKSKYNVNDIKTLLRWKLGRKPTGKKEDLYKLCMETPDPPLEEQWTAENEQQLQALKTTPINKQETALGVAANQMSRALSSRVDHLTEEEAGHLLLALQTRADSQPADSNGNPDDQRGDI